VRRGVHRFGHELEKPTYALYIYTHWANQKTYGELTPAVLPFEVEGLGGDMTGDALEGENPCDEGKPGRVPYLKKHWFYGCHNWHFDLP
jgi:hypothetical protein